MGEENTQPIWIYHVLLFLIEILLSTNYYHNKLF